MRAYLAGLIEQLMLELLDAEDILEHLVQLVLAEDELGRRTGCHTLLRLAWVLVTAVDRVKLGHPGAQHCLLAQAIYLWEATHTLLNVSLEDLPAVISREAAALDHLGHAVTLQEHLCRQRLMSISALGQDKVKILMDHRSWLL